MKIYSFRIASLAFLALAAVWMGQRQGHFNREIASLESKLLEGPSEKSSLPLAQQSWEELPPVVQRYFSRVFQEDGATTPPTSPYTLPMSVPAIRSLRFNQHGSFRLGKDWYPFVARQTVSALPHSLGFVWEAALSFLPHTWELSTNLIKVRVCDAYVQGRAYLNASLWGILTLAHKRSTTTDAEDDSLVQGELLRWLAEAPLYPSILLPDQGIVTWQAVEEGNQALLQMVDPFSDTLAGMLVTFDPQGLIQTIECKRPRALPKGGFSVTPWKGYFSNHEARTNMWVPTHFECGWILDNVEELYFKGDNADLEYEFVNVGSTTSTTTTTSNADETVAEE